MFIGRVNQMSNMYKLDQIQQLFSETTFYRGKMYHQQGRVLDLSYDKEAKRWFANVVGTDEYQVEVAFGEKNKISVNCQCPALSQYGQCKHIVAVLLEIHGKEQKEQDNSEAIQTNFKREFHDTNRIIDIFSSNFDELPEPVVASIHRDLLSLEVICKIQHSGTFYADRLMEIELKVGLKRPYVVKKIRPFLESVMEKKSHLFTNQFSYDPMDHGFTEKDLELLELLYAHYKNERAYNESSSGWYHSNSYQERGLLIPPTGFEPILEKLVEVNTSVEVNNQSYQEIQVFDTGSPLHFRLEKGAEETYQLDLGWLQKASFLKPYGYVFYEGAFYKLTKSQQNLLTEMVPVSYMALKKHLTISPNQMQDFVSHVLPGLKKIGELTISESVSDKIKQPSLKSHFRLDYRDGQLTANIEYHYDELVFNPFNHSEMDRQNEDFILMRDMEKERYIMRMVESSAFKFNGDCLYVNYDEDIYDVLYDLLPKLDEHVEIFMTESAKDLMTTDEFVPSPIIDVNSSLNLLEIQFDQSGIDQGELQHLLNSVVEKKKYYRMNSGAFVSLEDESFQTVGRLFEELRISKAAFQDEKIQVPISRGLQIEDILQSQQQRAKFSKTFQELVEHIKNPEHLDFEIPTSVTAILRDYQRYGFQWLKTLSHYHLGGILADDMGLGKTLQSITFLASEKEKVTNNQEAKPSLVIAPASLIYNWKREFEKFAPHLNIVVIAGGREARQPLLENPPEADVWITSYPLIRQDIDFYLEHHFDYMILDEAQAIKNHSTRTAKAVKKIRAWNRFALSGTPIENRLDELWSIFDAVLPGLFPSLEAFRQIDHERIASISRPFILRRVKKDVLKELPDKIETVQTSELTKEQKELYLAYLAQIQQETMQTIENEGFSKSKLKILAGLTRLRQLCCHPSLFIENYQGKSGKLEQLLQLLETSRENGNRLLIFSQFSSMLKLIRTELEQRGYEYFYLDGSTPSLDRLNMAERFNEGEKEVFLISLKAGGTGLNLTGADTVVLYDLWWNPAVEQQAADRAHRIGQKKVVQVIRLITEGTIEEKIYALQNQKRELIDAIIQPGETMLSSLSESDIKELLMIGEG